MKKPAHIDLTPLLDVLLLLVFGFMFILASNSAKLTQTETELETYQTDSAETIASLSAQNEALEQTIANLESAMQAQTDTLNTASSGIAEYFSLSEAELESLLSQQSSEDAAMWLSQNADATEIAKNMVMYELLSQEFYFIEIVLSGDDNHLVINGEKSTVNIQFADVATTDSKAEKKQTIKNAISSVIDARPGGSSMVFVTLATDNPDVYHYAWSLAWQSVNELTEKYGAKNYFCAELFIKERDNDE